ncbi:MULTISPECIES: GNAT family N-acetyltransferase [Vibrio oreintalis group]|uniref:GNAT family N-acetyltransferase n=1 Tax=Vibrio oreintalis group TaxID=1891919 RepID=UPI002340EA06|nr:GNAT family protein [Vibrio europaeus]MDC5839277.1 GNAT family N-acetyltransferase [Vibrio europaeus]
MFTQKVDDDISIALVQESFAVKYSELVTDQIDYLSQWLAWPPHCTSEQDFRLFVQRVLHEYAEGKTITCAIVYRGEIVGNCSCFNIDYDTKCLEIGYWLSKHHQGNGIVTRVVKHLIDFAFNQLNMEKVQLSAAVENRASRSVAERSGMTLEGVITNQEKIGERILDHAIYGIHRNR